MAKVLETAQSLAEALTTLETHLHTLPLFRPGVNAAEFLSHLTKQELAQLNVALSYACYSLVWSTYRTWRAATREPYALGACACFHYLLSMGSDRATTMPSCPAI